MGASYGVDDSGGFRSSVGPVGATFKGKVNLTDIDAPNYRVIEIDAAKPDKKNWKVIIPESENLLQSASTVGKKLFADYLQNATTRYYQMDYDGKNKKEIKKEKERR